MMIGVALLGYAPIHSAARTYKKKKKEAFTLGFETGKTIFTTPGSKQVINDKKLFLNKTIGKHVKLETGFQCFKQPSHIFIPATKDNYTLTGMDYSIPLSMDFYLLPQKSKLNTYCGIGLQYNHLCKQNACYQGDQEQPTSPYPLPGTHLVSILFTQGVTYEVNTRIQVKQSIHFIPQAGNKTIGLDLGIGFKLP